MTFKVLEKRALAVGEFGVDPDMDELSDLLFDRHLTKEFVGMAPRLL